MSWQALNWAAKQKCGSPITKSVLLVLANYSSEDGYCYPSQSTLCEITELSERAVRTHLSGLEELGLIQREDRRRANGTRKSDGFWLMWNPENGPEKVIGKASENVPINRHVVPDVNRHVVPDADVAENFENSNLSNSLELKNGNHQPARSAGLEPLIREPSENLNLVEDRKNPDLRLTQKVEKKKPPDFTAEDYDLALKMAAAIAARYPAGSPPKPPNCHSWSRIIRLLRERDGRSLTQIRSLFEWAMADSFWSRNVLCPATLRKQWDRLVLQRETSQRGLPNARASPSERKPKCCLCQREGYYRHEYDWYCRNHEREWSEAS